MSTEQVTARPATWDSDQGEADMEKGHEPSWRALIEHIDERDLCGKSVLDYGCNRGGFLRLLYDLRSFERGVGVDIAVQSLDDAERRKGDIPVTYKHVDELTAPDDAFDLAFSHEVIYLLPDLEAHARYIKQRLKESGIYYIAIGEYAENPLWERWKETVSSFSPVSPVTHSLQDIALAFRNEGFDVSVRRMVCDGFLPYDPTDTKYLQNPMELIKFMTEYMILFRMEKNRVEKKPGA